MDALVVAAIVAVPGVRDVFLDLLRVARIYGMHRAHVAAQHDAARILERLRSAITLRRKFAVAEVVLQAAAPLRPVLVERGDSEHIGDINLIDELSRLID